MRVDNIAPAMTSSAPPDPLEARPALRRGLVLILLVAGLVPRVFYLLYRGELWADEINLALNIGPRGFLELGRPFLHLQVAPWGFMVPIKALVSVLGESTLTYRLVPFAAGLVAAGLAYPLGRRLLGPTTGVLGLAFTSLSFWLTHYSVELKPYGLDAAVAAGLGILGLRVLDAPDRRGGWIALGAAGVLAGWVSLPSLFVLGGIGLALALDAWVRDRTAGAAARLGALAAGWVGSFVVHYQLFVAKSSTVTEAGVARYWAEGFAPFPPTTWAELKWYPAKFMGFFDAPGGLALRYLAGVLFLVGVVFLVRRRKLPHAVALAAPMLLAILASAMGKYSSVGRLMLFATPAALVLVAAGLTELGRLRPRALVGAVLVAGLLVVPRLGETYVKVLNPEAPKELHHVMAALAPDLREGDLVFLAGAGLATLWEYHSAALALPNRYIGVDSIRTFDEQGRYPALREVAEQTFGHRRVWLVAESRRFGGDPKRRGRSVEPLSTFLTRFFERWGGTGHLVYQATDLGLFLYDLTAARLPEGIEAIENAEPGGI